MASFQVISPVDGSVYASREYTNAAEIDKALRVASDAQRQWADSSLQHREQICLGAIQQLLEKQELLAQELSWQMGRPVRYGAGEIKGFAERGQSMTATALKKLQPLKQPQRSGFERFIKRVPLGVVLNMVPWNYPYLTAVNLVIPALMAGNAVLLKPSSQTPLTAERIAQAFQAAGLPAGLLQVLLITKSSADQTSTG